MTWQNTGKMTWELTEEEISLLYEDEKAAYKHAAYLMSQEHAHGPFGGWADGREILKSLGWKETTRQEGHRSFITLTKP